MRRCIIVVAVLALVTSRITFAQNAPVAGPTADVVALRQSISDILSRDGIPGAGIAIVRHDSIIWSGGVGLADVQARRPVTGATQFRVGSVSKSFVALGVMQLVEAGSLSLDAPLRTIAPEVAQDNPFEKTNPVRVVNLLEHTAGWDDFHFNEGWNVSQPLDIPLVQVVRTPNRSRTARWAPGTRATYSSPGYGIAGYLIEKLGARPYEDVLRDSILLPLGMSHSDFRFAPSKFPDLSQSYTSDAITPSRDHMQPYLRPAGNLVSTPDDFAKFLLMVIDRGHYNGQQLLSQAGIERMEATKTTTASQHGLTDGYGFALGTNLSHAIVMHGKNGAIDDGFYAQFLYSPEYHFGFVYMINRYVPAGADSIADALFRFASDGVTFPVAPVATVPAAALAPLTGHYVYRSSRIEMLAPIDRILQSVDITLHGDTLFEQMPFQSATPLVPLGNGLFRLRSEPASSRVFFVDGEHRVIQGRDTYFVEGSALPAHIALVILAAATLAIISILIAAIIASIARVVRRKPSPFLRSLVLPVVAVASLVGGIVLLSDGPVWQIGHANARTVGFAIATVLFALFAAASFVVAIRRFDRARIVASMFVAVVSVILFALAGQLAAWHWIGLRVWV